MSYGCRCHPGLGVADDEALARSVIYLCLRVALREDHKKIQIENKK